MFPNWGEINDRNTVKLRIYGEGRAGRRQRYTESPPMPHLPGWCQPEIEIPRAGIGLPSISAASWAPDRVDVLWTNLRAPGGTYAGTGPNPDRNQISHVVGKPENWGSPMTIRLPDTALAVAATSDRVGGLDVSYDSGTELWHLRWIPESGLPETSIAGKRSAVRTSTSTTAPRPGDSPTTRHPKSDLREIGKESRHVSVV